MRGEDSHDRRERGERGKEERQRRSSSKRSSVSSELESVPATDGLVLSTLGVVETVTLSLSSRLLAGSGETTGLTVLVDGVGDPVDPGITADGLVLRVDTDDLEVLVNTVLIDPVRVENSQVGGLSAHSLLGGGSERSLVLEVVHTLVDGLTVGGSLWHRLLAVTTAHTDTVDDEALLGPVAQAASLVRARRSGSSVNHVELTVLPAPVKKR